MPAPGLAATAGPTVDASSGAGAGADAAPRAVEGNGAVGSAHLPSPTPAAPTTSRASWIHEDGTLETDFLIVGAGPAGASLACFLGAYGLKGVLIAAAAGTADTPRAHITNMAALECLRDIGLEPEVMAVATDAKQCMQHTRWCHSMAGEEYARMYSWGNDPQRKGDYERASPCRPVDLPQTLLEPVLVRYATHRGFQVRFSTALKSFVVEGEDGEDGQDGRNGRPGHDGHSGQPSRRYLATVHDRVTGRDYHIRARYIFGADGAQSQVVRQLGLPLVRKAGGGLAVNVLVRADLSHLMDARCGNLHWVLQPDREHPAFAWMGVVRMVKPWHEWMFILLPRPEGEAVLAEARKKNKAGPADATAAAAADAKNTETAGPAADTNTASRTPTHADYLQRVRDFIGDDTPAEILNVSTWQVNEIVAETYSVGNVFCLGDAVHRHPPMNGLGSNTCIQDAFNLAWKIAYVHQGLAAPALLDSYSVERQPVGAAVVARANEGFRDHLPVWEALGMTPTVLAERRAALAELQSPDEAGRARRVALQRAIQYTVHEFHGLGIEMGQHYTGAAVCSADEPGAAAGAAPTGYAPTDPRVAANPVLFYEPSTFPGSRLPHVWLNSAVPSPTPTSTIDLAGHRRFVLLTGVAGAAAWKAAATRVAALLTVQAGTRAGTGNGKDNGYGNGNADGSGPRPIQPPSFPLVAYSIGFRQDWEDFYYDWERLRGVDESGAVLVRPDRFVAWRCHAMPAGGVDACAAKLEHVMHCILGWDASSALSGKA